MEKTRGIIKLNLSLHCSQLLVIDMTEKQQQQQRTLFIK